MFKSSREFESRQSPWSTVPGLLASLVLSACTAVPPVPVNSPDLAAAATHAADVQRIGELEHLLSLRQRQYAEEKRRLERDLRFERDLKECQKRSDDLQKKLDAILAIDRELRRGSKWR